MKPNTTEGINRRDPSPWFWMAVACEVVLLMGMSRHGDFLRAGEAVKFSLAGMAATAAYWAAAAWHSRQSEAAATRPRPLFWLVAIMLRLSILPVQPGDDLWRYRWEGAVQLHGFNPYLLAPDSAALATMRDADWRAINHRDHAAIYPPLAEATFAGLAALKVGVTGYKCLFALVDLGIVFILRRLLQLRGRAPDLAAWYAWNPLVIYSAAGAAHFDGLMIACLLGAIWLLELTRKAADIPAALPSWAPPVGSALLLGASIGYKAVPLIMAPTWFFALGWRRALWILPIGLAVAPLAALAYGYPYAPVFDGLSHFARDFRVNDAVWWILDLARGRSSGSNDLYPWALAAACGVIAIAFRANWRRGLLWLMGAALLLSPLLHAWYVVWILPLAAWRAPDAQPWFVLSGSVFGYFLLWEVNHASGRPWEEPLWLRALIYLPPLLASGWQALRARNPDAAQAEAC